MGLLDGKVGLIVGIANNHSYAFHIAKALTQHGMRCCYTHLPGEKNERRTRGAVKELHAESDEPWVASLDAASDANLDEVFAKYNSEIGRMDCLVHSIAFADRSFLQPGAFFTTSREAYLSAIDISAYTLLAMAQRAKPIMEKTSPEHGGSIMCMSYYGAEKVVTGYNVMGVAKAALECTTRYLAEDMGQFGIRVNAISGGYLRTLASSAVGGASVLGEAMKTRAPLRRPTEGSDVGGTAVYLASDLGAGVTGETIYVDSGMNIIGS